MSEIQNDLPQSWHDRGEEILSLREKLAEAQAAQDAETAAPPATSTSDTSKIGVATVTTPPPPAEGVAEQQTATHALAPGMAGENVAQLATTVEAAGEKTYLSDPNAQNHAHVFTDDLLEAIRRVLHAHPDIAGVADESERQRLNRWIGSLQVVTAEVWQLIQDVADQKAAPAS